MLKAVQKLAFENSFGLASVFLTCTHHSLSSSFLFGNTRFPRLI